MSFIECTDRGGMPISRGSVDSGIVEYRSIAALTETVKVKPLPPRGGDVVVNKRIIDKVDDLPQSLKNSPVVAKKIVSSRNALNDTGIVEILGETEEIMGENSSNNSLSVVSQFSNSSISQKLESGKKRSAASIKKAELRGATVAPSGLWRKHVWSVKRTIQIWIFLISVVVRLLRLRVLKMMQMQRGARTKKLRTSECTTSVKASDTVSHLPLPN